MSSLVKWLETYVLPPASRLAQLRWLVAMRDTFISLLPHYNGRSNCNAI